MSSTNIKYYIILFDNKFNYMISYSMVVKRKNNKKTKHISFTVNDELYNKWQEISEKLVYQRIFRNKHEIIEKLVAFLENAEMDKLLCFRDLMERDSEQEGEK